MGAAGEMHVGIATQRRILFIARGNITPFLWICVTSLLMLMSLRLLYEARSGVFGKSKTSGREGGVGVLIGTHGWMIGAAGMLIGSLGLHGKPITKLALM